MENEKGFDGKLYRLRSSTDADLQHRAADQSNWIPEYVYTQHPAAI